MTRGLMRAAADYDSSGGNDAQPASRRSAARMSIPARQELICDPVFQMFRRATYIILVDEGVKGGNKRCEVWINCLVRGRAAAKAGRSFKHLFFFRAQLQTGGGGGAFFSLPGSRPCLCKETPTASVLLPL